MYVDGGELRRGAVDGRRSLSVLIVGFCHLVHAVQDPAEVATS